MLDNVSPALLVEDRLLAVEGGTIFARSWTPAAREGLEPILLFHDSLGAVELWRDFPAILARTAGRQVIAYDRLGYGQSSPRTDVQQIGFVAAEAGHSVPALCAAFGLDHIIVCGHSVGGGMAIETAAQCPERVAALITIAAQVFVEDCTLAGISAGREMFADPANLQRLARYHGDKARWVVDAWTETWLNPKFADWTLESALAEVRCPTLAIHGEHDEYGTAAQPARIAAATGGEHLILAGIGHLPPKECPDRLAETIASFLARKAWQSD